jgi:hypothetical protein
MYEHSPTPTPADVRAAQDLIDHQPDWITDLSAADQPQVARIFHEAARTHRADDAALLAVAIEVGERLARSTGSARVRWQRVVAQLLDDIPGAAEAALWYCAFYDLPEAVRAAYRQLQTGQARDHAAAAQPSTERQLRLIHDLGYRGELPATLREASALIARLIGARSRG